MTKKIVRMPVCPSCEEAETNLCLDDDFKVTCTRCGESFSVDQVRDVYREFEDIGEGLLVPVEQGEEEEEEETEEEENDLGL